MPLSFDHFQIIQNIFKIMPDESCRKCGGHLLDYCRCCKCSMVIQFICRICGSVTTPRFHYGCYPTPNLESNEITAYIDIHSRSSIAT